MTSKFLKDITDYFKYDNDYWTKERKNAVKQRIAVYTLLPVIAFLGHTIAKKQYPWETAYSLGEAVQAGVEEISEDFPFRAQAHLNLLMSKRQAINEKELSDLLDNPITERNIKRVIAKDQGMRYSEVGGALIIAERNGEKFLKFLDVETEDTKFSKKIMSKLDNKEYLKQLFSNGGSKRMFEKMGVEDKYEQVTTGVKNGEINEKGIDLITKTYLQLSDRLYQQTHDEAIKLFYPRPQGEKTIGMFHIHTRGEGPSTMDEEASEQYGREVIIACRVGGYTLYELMNGKINNKITKEYKY